MKLQLMFGLTTALVILICLTQLGSAQVCTTYMGGISSASSSGGIHRYICCEGYSGTIQGGGSTEEYCGSDGRPMPEYQNHGVIASFSCSNIGTCMNEAAEKLFGIDKNVPGFCYFFASNFQECCEPGRRKKRQADEEQYDDKICPNTGNGKQSVRCTEYADGKVMHGSQLILMQELEQTQWKCLL